MTQIDVLKMAIEAGLAAETSDGRHQIWYPDNLCHFAHLVAAKEREALAQPAQEPQIAFNPEVVGYVAPQRKWIGLTNEELEKLSNKWRIIYGDHVGDFYHEIEDALRKKNNA